MCIASKHRVTFVSLYNLFFIFIRLTKKLGLIIQGNKIKLLTGIIITFNNIYGYTKCINI